MIDIFKDIHQGEKIAVLGSAPSLELYAEREDCVIAVNGASQINGKYEYFLTGHQTSHLKSWFRTREGVTRIINSMAAVYDPQLYPNEETRNRLIKEYEQSIRHPATPDPLYHFNRTFRNLPLPFEPHAFFYYGETGCNKTLSDCISREQKELFAGGTSAGLAVQVAHIMGASEIHLYGCAFDNNAAVPYRGDNYFYVPKEGEKGHTDENQRRYIEQIIQIVEQQGVLVFVHGPSRLQHHRRVE